MEQEIVESQLNTEASIFHQDTTRELLMALAQPRNSLTELFPDPILVSPKDLANIAQRVSAKLKQLRVEENCILLKTIITFDQDRTYQLIGWRQLNNFNWDISERTKSIVLNWEFLYKPDDYSKPELHILSVRITESINPMQFLRAALSSDRDEMEKLQMRLAPVTCEVDYVDNLLSRELVTLVNEWHGALRKPAPLTGIGGLIQKYQRGISKTVDLSLELVLPFAYFSGVYIWFHGQFEQTLTTTFVAYGLTFVMVFIFVARVTARFSSWMARLIEKHIERMGKFPIFELTSGDENNQTKAISKISASTYKFWFGIAVSFAINVASAVFTFYVLNMR
ncbi:MAG: hypothetical protein C0406_04830 [Sideroxydans sp.]|nr:hypothetical protein [Sideroxydans sp.]